MVSGRKFAGAGHFGVFALPPPDPAIVGDRWKAMWLALLNEMDPPPAARWMQHPQRDDYWRSGSVCEDYDRIAVPVLAVGGWADGYTNTVLRLLENLRGPRIGLIGPWRYVFPHIATPGPRIDFIGYVQRWFDQWLQGRETGIMAEPILTYWQQRPKPPRSRYVQHQGHWAAERRWPSADVRARTLHLAPGRLQDAPAQFTGTLSSPTTTGLASGEWCPYGWGPDMQEDQCEGDACSLCFDGPPVQGDPW